jgi:hypothetical protein
MEIGKHLLFNWIRDRWITELTRIWKTRGSKPACSYVVKV